MSVTSPPSNVPSPPSSLPRYRGLSGAIGAGLFAMGLFVLLGIVGGGAMWLLTHSTAYALHVMARFGLLAATAGAAVALSRYTCGTATDRIWNWGWIKGESSGAVGLLLGAILAGYLTEHGAPAQDAQEVRPVVGQVFDLAGPTLDGSRFDLAEHRGKVVLVDFWATWCGPCLAEMPNVRAAYDTNHGDGFEVIGVSLDSERTQLARFLEAHPEPWPQIFFDEEGRRGWDNPLARRYGVQAIPCLLVIGRDGKVAARNVRGGEIKTAVALALGQPVSWSDRLATAGLQLVGWLFYGVLESPWWLLVLGGVGGAVVLASAETMVRRAFQRAVIRVVRG